MKKTNVIFTSKRGRVWFTVSAVVLVLLIVATSLMSTVFRSILDTVLGGRRPVENPEVQAIYTSEYKNKKEVLEAGNQLNVKIEQEGAVLLLNEEIAAEQRALPLEKGMKVSVFGHNSVNLVLSGSGSGAVGSEGAKTLYDGLTAGGLEYNPTLKSFYESAAAGGKRSATTLKDSTSSSEVLDIGETPIANYSSDIIGSFRDYSDAAIVVISRIGGESFDLPREQSQNGGIDGAHYLQLDQNERDLLEMAASRFDRVIVLLNTLTSFQMDFIEEFNNYGDYSKRIDAVLWIGGPGISGAEAIGSLLNGEITPSGKTVDIYARDFRKDPTWQNFGDNSQTGETAAFTESGKDTTDYMVAYEEGVYVGYRYYETRAFEENVQNGNPDWYAENVIYPFGYGLSYTDFRQEMSVTETQKDGKTSGWDFSVTVENIGKTAGKDVVQLYVTLPYTYGGIEKSRVQLVDYAKTGLLAPGEKTETPITFHVDLYDLASYDYNDANGNGHVGYETEGGVDVQGNDVSQYIFYLGKNSHVDEEDNVYARESVSLSETVLFDTDPDTGVVVRNLYTEDTMPESDKGKFLSTDYRLSTVVFEYQDVEYERKGMSRVDFAGTFPAAGTAAERAYLDGEKEALSDRSDNNTEASAAAEKTAITLGADKDLVLRDLNGKEYDDAEGKWEALLDQLTFDEMRDLVNYGAFQTEPILSIGKNLTNDSDGPVGFVNFMPGLSSHYQDNPSFACEIVIASTWNKDLAYRMGQIVGETGLYGDESGNHLPYTGWYAPAVNIHRSPFSGRNYEYYSEDPILSGKMAVNVVNGAASKGVYTDLKHFALNDQETNRAGVATYCTEQALREIYLKPFEIAVKGKDDPQYSEKAMEDMENGRVKNRSFMRTTGIMSSFNRVGTRWAGGDYRLLTTILRGEWGFSGVVISDYITDGKLMPARQAVYAGNDLILTSTEPERWTDASATNKEDVYVLRKAAHNILYAVANSNSVNIDIIGYKMEIWMILVIVFDCIVVAVLGIWGSFAVRKD
ncbi:MAG: glycoside hydrolase family 3 C-terminal domain-containing protein [Lachnospiraceae bacterium]|nr:glycoside hydrolase family 3 C-terminal domain-containing protein [Lachnospiraceae bacterium]